MLRRLSCALAVATLIGFALPAHAQVVGQIQGTVTDAQGAVLPGVALTVRNTENGAVRTTVTEGDGQYRFAGLQPGTYELKAELQGFATVDVERLTITIGLQLQQDIKMQLQNLQETVTVTGEAPVIEVTRTEVAQVITQEQIDTLPMADRQPASLVLLLPGTNMDNTQVRRSQANIGAGGINNQMNAYFLDGSSNWSTNSGQQHAEMPQLAIREFRVNVAQASAEHGGNVAGLVSIVTRSGTNRFSGEGRWPGSSLKVASLCSPGKGRSSVRQGLACIRAEATKVIEGIKQRELQSLLLSAWIIRHIRVRVTGGISGPSRNYRF